MQLRLDQIILDAGTQTRATIDQNVVKEYAASMAEGVEFPRITVFANGSGYWLADGFHRTYAALRAKTQTIDAEVMVGTLRDAVLFSVAANATHGLRRTKEDKRIAVKTLLADPEWSQWSDREIARRCGVVPTFVGNLRKSNGVHDGQKEHQGGIYTLADWKAMDVAQRSEVMATPRSQSVTFNKQSSDSIEWAQWSWNPVMGCLHNCSYCYARDIAERLYPQKFVPAFAPERLDAPRNTKVPANATIDIGYKNVFTCSMADLFGKWVPREWIEAVLDAARTNPQWNFLFLTKFPRRLAEFEFPENAWVGTSVDAQARVANAEAAMRDVRAAVKWYSCEPMLEPLEFTDLSLVNWIVIGGASASTETPAFRPPRAWVNRFEAQAHAAGCFVYEKTNLLERLREYPGQDELQAVDVPAAFKMTYLKRDVLMPAEYDREMAAT